MLTFIDYLNENNDQVNDIQSIKTRKLLWKPEKSFKENAKLIEDKVLNFFKERFTSDDIGVFALYRWDELEELAKITNEYVNLMEDFEKGKGLIQKNISRGEKLFHEIASGMRNN